MLANAVRICEAKFGNLWLREGRQLPHCRYARRAAAFRDYLRREPVIRPDPGLPSAKLSRRSK